MSRRSTRRLLTAGLTTAVVGLLAGPALACPVDVTGHGRQTQAVQTRDITSIGATLPSARLGTVALAQPRVSEPSSTTFQATLTRNPEDPNANAFESPSTACQAPSCKELTVTVPAGGTTTLYALAQWPQVTQYVHLWAISPDGKTVVGKQNVGGSFDKRIGNAGVAAPVAQVAIPAPAAGAWRIQVRAAFGFQVPVTGSVALVSGKVVSLPSLDPTQLADSYMTQPVTYNIVFANRTPSKAEVAAFRDLMPTTFRNAVLEKQFSDGDCSGPDSSTPKETAGSLVNWGGAHYCGTAGGGSTGNVPYFEPTRADITYRFLTADAAWTGDLFKVMQANTKQDQPFTVIKAAGLDGQTPYVNPSRNQNTQGNYMARYDANDGKPFRGTGSVVTNPTVGDLIDPFPVEDWIFGHRYDDKYARSFTDLETGARHSGAFINPGKGAYYDPFYTAKGAKDLDTMPQGPTTSFTFFALDTFDGELAAKYFRSNAYHYFDVSKHMVDPDDGSPDGPSFARAWGGRYHFFLHDLGAGPNYYETSDSVLTNEAAGSAQYPNGDPPIWDYNSNPQWANLFAERTARDAKVWLFARFEAAYLYRPVPADVFFVANNTWEDCYSNPQCSADGISYTDLTKVYHADYVRKNLAAALPGATFTDETSVPGLQTFRYLGCAANRTVSNQNDTLALGLAANPAASVKVSVPDPGCVGKASDPLQEALELAKARGDDVAGPGVNDQGVSATYLRSYVEAHRAGIAPQPPGQFTITNVSVVFPQAMTWDLPLVVGGVAFGTPNNEAWGVLNNLNDRFKGTTGTDCSKSKPTAPGCNGVPSIGGGGGFTYTIEHESSHFLGLTHPHDMITVEKDAKGKWSYYGDLLAQYGDFSMAPTTYAGAFAPYSALDQDIIQRGHIGEYLSQTQDYLSLALQKDAMKGLSGASSDTQKKQAESTRWRDLGSTLFACGDYLHAEHAMRNASLAAQGTFGPLVSPRQLKPGEKVLFTISPQTSYGVDGEVLCRAASAKVTSASQIKTVIKTVRVVRRASAPSGSLAATGSSPVLPAAGGVLVLGGAVLVRRRRRAA